MHNCCRYTFRLMPLVDNELLYRPYTLGELYDVSAPALAPCTVSACRCSTSGIATQQSCLLQPRTSLAHADTQCGTSGLLTYCLRPGVGPHASSDAAHAGHAGLPAERDGHSHWPAHQTAEPHHGRAGTARWRRLTGRRDLTGTRGSLDPSAGLVMYGMGPNGSKCAQAGRLTVEAAAAARSEAALPEWTNLAGVQHVDDTQRT